MLKRMFIGFILGFAGIIPGISLGVVAIALNIYEDILESINNVFKDFKREIRFLFPIVIGIILGFVLGFILIKVLLNKYMFYLSCVFIAFMALSVGDVIKNQRKRFGLIILGIIIPITITILSIIINVNNSDLLLKLPIWFLMATLIIGVVIGVAQIIPGLSSTAILMMLGLFKPTINYISFNYIKNNPKIIIYLMIIIIGFIIGIFISSRLINKLLKKYPNKSLNILYGISIGSIITMIINNDMLAIYKSLDFGAKNIIIGIFIFIFIIVFYYIIKKHKNRL